MATAATSLLGLALPVTGELSGTWGDTVNVSITALLDTAVAGTTTLSSDSDVTLTTTTLAANQARQAIILWTAGGTVTRTITAPAQSKSYIVINKTSSSQSIKIVGVGPTTGVTIVAGTAAFVVWNGVDFVTASVTSTTGILPVANGGTGVTTSTGTGSVVLNTSPTLITPALGTPASGVVTNLTGTASININGTVGATTPTTGAFTTLTTSSTVTLSGGTANGVAYLDGSKVLTTGSALTYNGTGLGVGVASAGFALDVGGSNGTNIALRSTGTTSAVFRAYVNSAEAGTIGFLNGGGTYFEVAGTEGMRLTSTGLGIGTSSPVNKLVVSNAGAAGFEFDPTNGIMQTFNRSGSAYTDTNILALSINFKTGASPATVATIDSSGNLTVLTGNLGIGTSSPSSKLDVLGTGDMAGTFRTTGTTNAASVIIRAGDGTTSAQFAYVRFVNDNTTGQDWRIGTYGTNNLSFVNTTSSTIPLVLDSSGNLGIGTTTPTTILQASLSSSSTGLVVAGSVPTIVLYDSSGTTGAGFLGQLNTTTYLYNQEAGPMLFGTSNVEKMRLDASGNLGLGVTPSAWVAGSSALEQSAGAIYSISSGTWDLAQNAYNSATGLRYRNTTLASLYRQTSGQHVWYNAPSGTAGNAITFTQAMTLDASGNLGIGTTTIGSRLTIGDPGTGLGFSNAASGNFNIGLLAGTGSADAYVYQRANSNLLFGTNNTERARIDSSGNLLVGTTSTSGATGFAFISPGASSVQRLVIGHVVGNTTGDQYHDFFYNGSSIGSITQVSTTGVLYNVTSDYRLKTVLGPVADAGQRIDALQPVEYTWNADGSRTRGFLAHQFQEVYASSVSGTKDAVDAEGKPVYQSMQASTSEVIADLISELQSLRARVAQLESKP
jgi:hypothetical protein